MGDGSQLQYFAPLSAVCWICVAGGYKRMKWDDYKGRDRLEMGDVLWRNQEKKLLSKVGGQEWLKEERVSFGWEMGFVWDVGREKDERIGLVSVRIECFTWQAPPLANSKTVEINVV